MVVANASRQTVCMYVRATHGDVHCGMERICSGPEAGIEGWIHVVRLLWQKHAQEEDWEFLLIDVRNLFNEENRTDML